MAFVGDSLVEAEISKLTAQYGIKSAVETGTYRGFTAKGLAAIVPMVYTIELMSNAYEYAASTLAATPNVQQFLGSSLQVLPDLIPKIDHPTLYFLDAHWHGNFPLREELEIIASYDPQPIILIHDIKVPGHPELSHDPTPDGSPLCYKYVWPALKKIQSSWRCYYNKKVVGGGIGVLFVIPCERK